MNKAAVLANIPATLRDELVGEYNKLVANYREGDWEPTEMDGGKICEITYSILNGYVTGTYPARSNKPSNMVDACRTLEHAGPSFPRSVKIQIPRILIALYEIRSNRGAGHVGGDVNPNHMDSTFVLSSAKWILAELIRLFHGVSTVEAADAVELLTERELPMIWDVNGLKRVLSTSLGVKEKTLLLLYSVPHATDSELSSWVEYSTLSNFRAKILKPGHKNRLWEYNTDTGIITLSSLGSAEAETILREGTKS